MRRVNKLVLGIITLGVVSLILENGAAQGPVVTFISHVLDIIVFFLFTSMFLYDLVKTRDKSRFLKINFFEAAFLLVFLAFLVYAKYHYFFVTPYGGHNIPTKIVLAITLFNVYKVLMHTKKLHAFFHSLTTHPAQTIILSFIIVILVGTILLMMPLSMADQSRLGFVNSLFTATSATCVTGLIVVDTATAFSVYGKTIIMLLIQTGGLGIMILAAFAGFLIGKRLSFQDKLAMSYVLDESDTRKIIRGIKNILLLTFSFELCGALLLFPVFKGSTGGVLNTAFFSLFHAISAFCNAGFALFSDSLEQFRSSIPLNLIIASLIISGGISFIVMANSFRHLKSKFKKRFFHGNKKIEKLTLNTKVVLAASAILIVAGTLLIYKFEHKPTLLPFDIKTQYLTAFFQSVTLRTAGFNTLDMTSLHSATYALMILMMFIGGATGSTAGGIKVNSLGVIWAYVKSVFSNNDNIVLMKHSVSRRLVNQTFLVIFMGLAVVFAGTMFLTLSENKRFVRVMFETVSAFGTVGLSTGITPELSGPGKIVLTVIMLIGRIGPLTVITALSQKRRHYQVRYPEGKIVIG
ncbi:TrkH family potassium uptake protein [Candidatus Omnitrophota bacterium]